MDGDTRFEFAGAEWFEAWSEAVTELLHGIEMHGASVTLCEVFTNPPPHLLADGEDSIAFHLSIDDRGVTAGRGRPARSDLVSEADYEVARTVARTPYGNGPEALETMARLREEARATGKTRISGDESAIPPALFRPLFSLHDVMARQTR